MSGPATLPPVPGLDDLLPGVLELYLDLHTNPELSGMEERTAGVFAAALAEHGLRVCRGIGGHGVVGVLANGPGPMVLLRAELDALPVAEATGLPYASTVTAPGPDGALVPVMHACGHDVHLAALTGTADLLAGCRDRWSGTVLVVGQPAEETLSGARAMLEDGLYERFGVPAVVLAQHVAPFPAGRVAHAEVVLAAARSLRIEVSGSGGHSADPATVRNPIEAAAAIITGLRGLAGPGEVITVGTVHAGTAVNVVPELATVRVSVRAATGAGVERAVRRVRDLVVRTNKDVGNDCVATVEVTATAEPTVPDPGWAALVRESHRAELGAAAVLPGQTSMATEDFPAYTLGGTVPAVYWMLGCVGPRQWARSPSATAEEKLAGIAPNHSPRFAPEPVSTLRGGIRAMTAAALACLRGVSDV